MATNVERTTITQRSVWTPELATADDYDQTLDSVPLAAGDLMPGAPVLPESVEMLSLGANAAIQAEVETFRPNGFKYPTVTSLGREWTEWSIEGQPTYTEMVYPLIGLVNLPVVAAVGTAGGVFSWTMTPNTNTRDTVVSYTFEQGDTGTRIHKARYGTFSDLSISIDRSAVNLTATAFAQQLLDGVANNGIGAAITSFIDTSTTITTRNVVPILPSEICIYQNNNAPSSLVGDLLTRVISAEINISNRFVPFWALNCNNASWTKPIESEPEVTFTLVMEADNEDPQDLNNPNNSEIEGGDIGMAFLHAMRVSGNLTDSDHADFNRPIFFRVEGTGPEIGATGQDYSFRFDIAARVTDVAEFSDEDGVFAIAWTFTATHDADYGKAYEFRVVNNFNALAET